MLCTGATAASYMIAEDCKATSKTRAIWTCGANPPSATLIAVHVMKPPPPFAFSGIQGILQLGAGDVACAGGTEH